MKKNVQLIIFALITIILTACEKIDMTEVDSDKTDSSSSSMKSLVIKTRSADDTNIPYPITIYAFDNNGKCKAQTIVKEGVSREDPTFTLPRGQYHITAVHIPTSYPTQASNIESSTEIKTPTDNYAKEPLYLGATDVNLTSNNQNVDVKLNLKQAKLNISLTEVPTDVNTVSVTISSLYTKITLSDNYSNQEDVTITCTKAGNVWSTGDVYIMPSAGSSTNFTFKLTHSDGSQTSYSYKYNGSLNAGTPYSFEGKYSSNDVPDQLAIFSNISTETWNPTISKTFSFGPGASNNGENTEVTVTEFPEDGDIWNGHVVALSDMIDDNTCNLMLISLDEWSNVYSANNAENYSDAETLAEEYKEDGLTGWKIPTKEEAKTLKDVYGKENNFNILNKNIESCDGIPLSLTDGSSNARYLCEDGTYAFGFKSGSTISAAGATVKYHLRLIKNITAKKK